MTEKRKHDDAFASTPEAKTIVPVHIQPQKKPREQSTPAVERDYSTSQIRAFINGVSKIQDWTSNNILKKHIQMIYWFDIENLSKDECAKRYPNKQGQPCSMTNIFKVYNTYAPRFYAEKGLEYVPLGKRGSARAASVVKKKKKDKTTKKVRRNSLDVRLEGLFEKLPRPTLPSSRVQIWDEKPTQPCLRHAISNLTEDSQNSDDDKIVFLSSSGSTTYGSLPGLEIPRPHLLHHCSSIRDALLGTPRINIITHGPEISADTICRFAACVAEAAQSRLPESITTAYGTFKQEWSMADLEDLYVLAVIFGAAAVCDLVIDRWLEELRQPEPRVVIDEFGEVQYFDILEFGPELLGFLWANDSKGFAFFSNVLLSHGSAGLERMKTTHLANWHEGVKNALIRAMEEGGVIDLFSASPSTVCRDFHHHSPQQFKNCVPERQPGEMSKATAVPTMPARPTLNSSRPRYDDFEDTSHTLHLTIPPFPYAHNKYPEYRLQNWIQSTSVQRTAPTGCAISGIAIWTIASTTPTRNSMHATTLRMLVAKSY